MSAWDWVCTVSGIGWLVEMCRKPRPLSRFSWIVLHLIAATFMLDAALKALVR